DGLPQRRQMAARYPASRLAGPLTPDEWSTALLLEVSDRLQEPDGVAMAIFELRGIIHRWPRTQAAALAKELLQEFDAASAITSAHVYKSDRLRFADLQARYYDAGFAPPPPRGYPVTRAVRLRIGAELWTEVLELAPPDSPVARHAKARISEYE